MGTITIASKKSEDLYFLSELVRRMGMKSKIKVDENSISKGRVKQNRDEEKVTAQSVVDGIKSGLKDVEEIIAGRQKPKTLKEIFDEC
ncbi:MAG: hypothetical protein K8S16_07965 [Bacteroidales bacterium]|nr:hypothetical protein [Bacteroidales bacterium]